MAEGENKMRERNLSRVPIVHLLVTVFFMMVLFAMCTAAAFAATDGDYTYVTTSAINCTVTGYTNTTATDVTIPSKLGGYNVTAIGAAGAGATLFANRLVLQSVTIPDGVTVINAYAFYNCRVLQIVSIPDGVTTIGNEAFRNCYMLADLTLPDSVNTIGQYALSSCGFVSLSIPEGVTTIAAGLCYNCQSLKQINLPDSITTIEHDAFRACSALTDIKIPKGLTNLDGGTFYLDAALTSISIPSTVTKMADLYFSSPSALKVVCFEGSLPAKINGFGVNTIGLYTLYFYPGTAGFSTGLVTYNVLNTDSAPSTYTAFGAYMYHIAVNSSSSDGSSNSVDGNMITGSGVTYKPDFSGIPGRTINLNVTKDGYTPTSISITSSGGSILYSGLANVPSFTMPAGDVVITATFDPITAPGVTVSTPTDDPRPTWTFTPANGGNLFRWRIDNYPAWTTTTNSYYTPSSSLSGGTHTLYVEELNNNGYWSAVASASVVIDTTAPTVTLSAPTGATVPVSTANIVLAFNKTVTDVLGKTVTVSDGTNDYVYTVSPSGICVSGTGTSCKATIPVSSLKHAGVPLSLAYSTTYTVKIEGGTYNNKSLVGNTANAALGSFKTESAGDVPTVSVSSLNIDTGGSGSFNIDLGSGSLGATSAAISSDFPGIAAVSASTATSSQAITINGLAEGTATVTISFNDAAHTVKTIAISVSSKPTVSTNSLNIRTGESASFNVNIGSGSFGATSAAISSDFPGHCDSERFDGNEQSGNHSQWVSGRNRDGYRKLQ